MKVIDLDAYRAQRAKGRVLPLKKNPALSRQIATKEMWYALAVTTAAVAISSALEPRRPIERLARRMGF